MKPPAGAWLEHIKQPLIVPRAAERSEAGKWVLLSVLHGISTQSIQTQMASLLPFKCIQDLSFALQQDFQVSLFFYQTALLSLSNNKITTLNSHKHICITSEICSAPFLQQRPTADSSIRYLGARTLTFPYLYQLSC